MDAGKLTVKIGADLGALRAGLAEGRRDLKRWGDDVGEAGQLLTSRLSVPIIAAGTWAVKLAGNLEATALSFRVLTKDAIGALAIQRQLNDYADKSPFNSEDVTVAGKRLVAYRFALSDVIPYLKDAGDLAATFADQGVKIGDVAAVFGRLKSGDFGEAFERLRDFGISRQQLEGEGLKFDKSGSYQGSVESALAAVRKIIQQNYGGMASELGTTLPGMAATAFDTVARLAEDLGKSLVESFNIKALLGDFITFIGEIRTGFNALSPDVKKAVLVLGAFAAIVPPLAAGIGGIISIMPALAAGFAAVTGPIGILTAAVVLLASNWDLVKRKGVEAAIAINEAYASKLRDNAQSSILIRGTEMQKAMNAEADRAIAKANELRRSLNSSSYRTGPVIVGDQGAAEDIRYAAPKIGGGNNPLKPLTDGAKEATKALIELSDARIKAGLDGIKFKDNGGHAVASSNTATIGPMASKLGFSGVKPLTREELTGYSLDINVAALSEFLRERDALAVEALKQGRVQAALEEANEGITGVLKSGTESIAVGFGEMLGGLAMGNIGAEGIGQMLLGTIGNIAVQLGKMAIGIGVGLTGIKAALQTLNPIVAIGAGIALVALGSIFKSGAANVGGQIGGGGKGVRSYASGYGGAYRDTLVKIGDHRNASMDNPEYVLRQDQVEAKLNRAADRAGGGKGGLVGTVRILGRDLELALSRQSDFMTSLG